MFFFEKRSKLNQYLRHIVSLLNPEYDAISTVLIFSIFLERLLLVKNYLQSTLTIFDYESQGTLIKPPSKQAKI